MRSQICKICLNSGILCTVCQEKVDTGEITNRELDVIRKISILPDKTKGLDGIEIKNIFETHDVIAIVCSKENAPKLVGRGASNVKKLSRELGKTVRIIEESPEKRTLLQNLIYPVPIVNLGLVYSPDGEKYKIKINSKRLPISQKSFIKIAEIMLGKKVSLEFHKEKQETTEEKIQRLMKKIN